MKRSTFFAITAGTLMGALLGKHGINVDQLLFWAIIMPYAVIMIFIYHKLKK
jgi:uncharacterized membrane protein